MRPKVDNVFRFDLLPVAAKLADILSLTYIWI